MSFAKLVFVSVVISHVCGIRVQQNIDFGMQDKPGDSEQPVGPPVLVRATNDITVEKGLPVPDLVGPEAAEQSPVTYRTYSRPGRFSKGVGKMRGRSRRDRRGSRGSRDSLFGSLLGSREEDVSPDLEAAGPKTQELKDYLIKAGSIGIIVEDDNSESMRNVYWLSGDYYGRNSSVSDSALQIIETPSPDDKKGLDALSAELTKQNLTSPAQFFNNHSLGAIAEAEEGSENGMYKIFDTAYVAGPSNWKNAFKDSTITVKFTSGPSKGKVMEVNANKFQPVLDEKFEGEASALDLVFVTDATGSMGAHLTTAKLNLLAFADHMRNRPEFRDVRIGAVFYKDLYPGTRTDMVPTLEGGEQKIFASLDLTDNFPDVAKITNRQEPSGGGDAPEALTQALYEGVLPMSWRKDSTKIMVIIADAPPHGLGGSDRDSWPYGEPNFNHKDGNQENVFAIGQQLASLKITAYSLVVPMDGHARDYFLALSEFTGGASFPLIQAGHAFRAIRAAAKRSSLQEHYLKRVDDLELRLGREPTTEEIADELRGVEVVDVASTDIYEGLDKTNVGMFKRLMESPDMAARYHLDQGEVSEISFALPEKYRMHPSPSTWGKGGGKGRARGRARGRAGSMKSMDISRARGGAGIRTSAKRASSAEDYMAWSALHKVRKGRS